LPRQNTGKSSSARAANDTLIRLVDTNLVVHRTLVERGWNMRSVHRRTTAVLRRVEEALTETRAMVTRNGGEVTRIRKWNPRNFSFGWCAYFLFFFFFESAF
jgi:hypothetical protein